MNRLCLNISHANHLVKTFCSSRQEIIPKDGPRETQRTEAPYAGSSPCQYFERLKYIWQNWTTGQENFLWLESTHHRIGREMPFVKSRSPLTVNIFRIFRCSHHGLFQSLVRSSSKKIFPQEFLQILDKGSIRYSDKRRAARLLEHGRQPDLRRDRKKNLSDLQSTSLVY